MRYFSYENLIKWILVAGFAPALFTANAFASSLNFGGFSELRFTGSSGDETGNSFAQGGIDLYLNKNLDSKTNILAEVVFEISEENEAILDPERIWIQHEISPWFKVKAGRVHTALGYWNESFHHGAWLQTTVDRPIALGFEDDGGILPVHSIGLEFRGSGKIGEGILGYIVDVGNGRGENPDPPQTAVDYDDSKAVSALVYYSPFRGLRFGATVLIDKTKITANFDDDGDEATAAVNRAGFSENLLGAHVVWSPGNTELIFEGYSLNHKYDADEALSTTLATVEEADNTITAWYLQVSHRIGKWIPYARYEITQTDEQAGDAFLSLLADTEVSKITAGVRYNLTYTSALKGEFSNSVTKVSSAEISNVKNYSLSWSYAW